MLDITAKAAAGFGAVLLEEDLLNIEMDGEVFKLKTESLKEIKARAVVLAPGISRKKLNVEGEKEYHGLGVSYCATCDCNFFKKKTVAVLGDASMAASAALLLREYASKVYWVAKEFKASPELMDKVKGTDIEMVQAWLPRSTATRWYGNDAGQRPRPGPRRCVHRARREGRRRPGHGSEHIP